jgi:hypothetical protein
MTYLRRRNSLVLPFHGDLTSIGATGTARA